VYDFVGEETIRKLCKGDNNIKVDVQRDAMCSVDWIDVAYNKGRFRAPFNAVKKSTSSWRWSLQDAATIASYLSTFPF
jgi:hypothetical protein